MPSAQPSETTQIFKLWGTVQRVLPGMVRIAGVSHAAGIGNEVRIETRAGDVFGDILSVEPGQVTAQLYASENAIRIGDKAFVEDSGEIAIGDHWLGQILDYRGKIAGPKQPQTIIAHTRALKATAPPSPLRRGLGPRLATGLMATDTLLPLCRGQRMGLFAGSGVGKSTLLGKLAAGIVADRLVIALIGERSREVNAFLEKLPSETRARSVIIAATASDPAGAKKRAAYCALAAAEHFRDQGHHVMLLFDSLTRFAEAHRETALSAGEAPALNAFPPSTVRVLAELVERAGPGTFNQGDITGIFSVLVAGSDTEEPLADMVRGILDGHIVLSRDIAERGRYPAIDVLRSISRCLPEAASTDENQLLNTFRRLIAAYENILPMLRADLYEPGKDPETDLAISLFDSLDRFVGESNPDDLPAAFDQLKARVTRPES